VVEPIIVSYSELDTFRQCPLKHAILYGQRWTKPVKEGSALQKGSLYHAVMEEHMRVVKAWQDRLKAETGSDRIPTHLHQQVLNECWEAVRPLLWDNTTGTQTDVQELIEWMYEGWIENYGINEDWRIVGVEHQIITPLRDERGRRSRYHLKAKIDLIIRKRDTGGLWVVDHKSGANLPTDMDLEVDDQFGLYTWAMREVGKRITGTIHAANRTQRNKSFMPLDTRMKLTYLNRSEQELTNIALDAYRVARAAHPPASQKTPPYSSPDPRQCGWKCDLKEPHLLMRRGRKPAEVLTEYGYVINRTRH
jgi:hypothetical protein